MSGEQLRERLLVGAIWVAAISLLVVGVQVGANLTQSLLDTANQMVGVVVRPEGDAPTRSQPRLDPNWVAYECADPQSTSPSCPAFWESLDQMGRAAASSP